MMYWFVPNMLGNIFVWIPGVDFYVVNFKSLTRTCVFCAWGYFFLYETLVWIFVHTGIDSPDECFARGRAIYFSACCRKVLHVLHLFFFAGDIVKGLTWVFSWVQLPRDLRGFFHMFRGLRQILGATGKGLGRLSRVPLPRDLDKF